MQFIDEGHICSIKDCLVSIDVKRIVLWMRNSGKCQLFYNCDNKDNHVNSYVVNDVDYHNHNDNHKDNDIYFSLLLLMLLLLSL